MALLTASTDIFNKLPTLQTAFHGLPSEARWITVAMFAVIAAILLYAAFSRRSVLLKPERFIVSADDPQYLVGREEHIKELIDECEHAPLVFLIGESGAGKSALIQAGVLPRLHASAATDHGAARLLPLRIDASPLAWQNGLRDTLTNALYSLSATERDQLGAPHPFDATDPFGWLASVPPHRARKLLLILDQMDDYLLAHQQHFVSQCKVVSPSRLTATHTDWAALARLIGEHRLHVVLICRADSAAMLDALRFTDTVITYLLPRVEEHLLAPLLEALTKSRDTEVVVADPEYGWVQLKSRLLRDLSSGGQVLPVQLAVALNSLRRLRYLTPREYERHGGLRGLERLHIERHVHDAARGTGVNEAALLRGLLSLVNEDRAKTRRISRSEFTTAVLGDEEGGKSLDIAVESLERWRIVRRQFDGGEEFLLLYHDYLTRGVLEAYFQANRWTELLQRQHQMFTEALGLRQRWRALLAPESQLRLLGARLRRRFHYGIHRAFALWSMLRLLPWIAMLVGIVVVGLWGQRTLEHHRAENLIAGILTEDDTLSPALVFAWRTLATAQAHARLHAVRSSLATPVLIPKLTVQTARVAHTVLGLDVDGSISHQLIRDVLVPALMVPNPVSDSVLAVAYFSMDLHYTPETASIMTAALVKRMETESDSGGLARLGGALGTLSAKLEPRDVQPGAAVLVKRMETESDSGRLAELGAALGTLSGKLEGRDVQPGMKVLLKHLENAYENQEELVQAWLKLERVGNNGRLDRERLEEYVKVLQLPLMIGGQRRAVLIGLENLTGEKFLIVTDSVDMRK